MIQLIKKQRRTALSLLIGFILCCALVACQSKTVPERFSQALREGNFQAAEEVFLANSNESIAESLDHEFATYLLDKRCSLNKAEISSDDFTTLLNEIANYRLTDDHSLLEATVTLQNEHIDASEMIGQARNAAQLSDWPEAMRLLKEAKAYAMSTASVRELFANVSNNYKQDISARVKTLESKGSLQAASDLLVEAVEYIPNDNDLAVELTRINNQILSNEQKSLLQNVQNLRAEGAWQPALDAINAASEAVRQTSEVKALKEQLERSYEDSLLKTFEAFEADSNHVAALEQVEKDLEIFPNSLRLKWKKSVYEAIVLHENENP